MFLSAHPVCGEMRRSILAELCAIEAEHGVTVLFACESGSRGWGFASPDSDYDVRFIYVHRLRWYLAVEPGRDVIERPISGDLDVSGWDLRKALGLLRQSNPILMEWLDSPIVYREEAATMARFRTLARQAFSPLRGYHHYVAMAKKNFRGYLQGDEVRYKKYLYVLRPLLAARWLRDGRGVPPMRFAELAQASLQDPALVDEINRLLEVKMRAGEAATSARWPGIHAFIEAELAQAETPPPLAQASYDPGELDGFLFDSVMGHQRAAP